jgi:uncharacterized protein YprB with RNaseH-like and TPR domain
MATIERKVLQLVREDDLPGSEAPAAWLSYLRGGSAHNLRRVLAHNHPFRQIIPQHIDMSQYIVDYLA